MRSTVLILKERGELMEFSHIHALDDAEAVLRAREVAGPHAPIYVRRGGYKVHPDNDAVVAAEPRPAETGNDVSRLIPFADGHQEEGFQIIRSFSLFRSPFVTSGDAQHGLASRWNLIPSARLRSSSA